MIEPDLTGAIRRRAHDIWESEGRPEGRDRIHWIRAEAEFREKLATHNAGSCKGGFHEAPADARGHKAPARQAWIERKPLRTNAAIAVLTREHQIIMKVVNALSAMSDELARGRSVAPQKFRDVVRFMREFADKCHHAKEDDILFPEMAMHGVPETGCPLGALRQEHVQARQLVSTLAERTEAYARREEGAVDALTEIIGDIGRLYSSHIWKEDNMVFPMVDRLFSLHDIERLAERFERAEMRLGQDHETLERLALDLQPTSQAPAAVDA